MPCAWWQEALRTGAHQVTDSQRMVGNPGRWEGGSCPNIALISSGGFGRLGHHQWTATANG